MHSPSRPASRRLSRALVVSALVVPLVGLASPAFAAPPADPPGKAAPAAAAADPGPGAEKAPKATENKQKKAAPAEPAAQQPAPGKGKGTAKGKGGASGDTSSPQPLSRADKNGTGANPGTGCDQAYCSTRDGSPSGNGNGDGVAKGKPCAGCVGKADNKNPPGQAPDGTDGNAGYECDRNKGIGRTNPAHTGCVSAAEQPPPQTCASNPALEGCPPPQTCASNPALEGCPSETGVLPTPPLTKPELPSFTPTAPATTPVTLVAARAAVAPLELQRPTVLPFTGADLTGLVPLAASLLALGAAATRAGRTRRPAVRS